MAGTFKKQLKKRTLRGGKDRPGGGPAGGTENQQKKAKALLRQLAKGWGKIGEGVWECGEKIVGASSPIRLLAKEGQVQHGCGWGSKKSDNFQVDWGEMKERGG